LAPDERRVFPRREVREQLDTLRLDHSLSALRRPHLSLSLRDLSVGGLSAISDVPLMAGERLSVSYPTKGMVMGWNAYGRVVRCAPSGMGYRVAVEFESIPAAA
jgi:hypothetical protein